MRTAEVQQSSLGELSCWILCISIFQPLIPAVAGGGVLKSLLLLASVTGVLDNQAKRIKKKKKKKNFKSYRWSPPLLFTDFSPL